MRRRTMLPPIRPNPIMPSCMFSPSPLVTSMTRDLFARSGQHMLDGEAELRQQVLERRRRAERVHAQHSTVRSCVAIPAEQGGLLDGHACPDAGRQDAVAIGLILLLEQLPRR